MINVEEHSRIIGDFLEINADILIMKHTSKYPKFLANLIAKFNYKKLIKSVGKIKSNKIVLNKDNLFELFAYIFNNFPPDGKYDCVYKVLCVFNNNIIDDIEAIVKFDNINCIITIEKGKETFSINILEKIDNDTSKQYTIDLERMHSDNLKTKEIVRRVNDKLLEVLTNFILGILSNYK